MKLVRVKKNLLYRDPNEKILKNKGRERDGFLKNNAKLISAVDHTFIPLQLSTNRNKVKKKLRAVSRSTSLHEQ